MDSTQNDLFGEPLEESDFEVDDRNPSYKLDLTFFTAPDHCPAMVRRGSRKSFELFVFLAHQWLTAFQKPISPTHEDLCAVCGLEPSAANSRSTLSHLLGKLRDQYRVIEYERVRRRRPQIRLRGPASDGRQDEPRHYVYWDEPWDPAMRKRFDRLGSSAFAAQYMYVISRYEADLARLRHNRAYWFFPLARLSATFHISQRFAQAGLQSLVKLGVLHVIPGQFQRDAPNDEFGRANRYFFRGAAGVAQRHWQLKQLQQMHGGQFRVAVLLADALVNGRTIKNVAGLCELLATHDQDEVRQAIQRVSGLPTRSLKRRLAYVRWLLENR